MLSGGWIGSGDEHGTPVGFEPLASQRAQNHLDACVELSSAGVEIYAKHVEFRAHAARAENHVWSTVRHEVENGDLLRDLHGIVQRQNDGAQQQPAICVTAAVPAPRRKGCGR
jgi:hypothetical protein